MNTLAIDHTTAEFDFNSLTRGYAAASKGGKLVYAKKVSPTKAHCIVSDRDGFWEFVCFSRDSDLRTAETTVDRL